MLRILFAALISVAASNAQAAQRPTIVLVHGAFADSSSWSGVIAELTDHGYPVVSAANPLRGVKSDAAYVSSLLQSLTGPIVLVGHSYGGTVISAASAENPNVKALVFVAAFALAEGESIAAIGERFPEGTLGSALAKPVKLPGGLSDLYIDPNKFRQQFAADVPQQTAATMALTQRPITDAALRETMGQPAWTRTPSWFIYGTSDKNIPRSALAFMAGRAKSRETVEIDGASHVVMISHPKRVSELIIKAAAAAK